jgi:hypothetical protein
MDGRTAIHCRWLEDAKQEALIVAFGRASNGTGRLFEGLGSLLEIVEDIRSMKILRGINRTFQRELFVAVALR